MVRCCAFYLPGEFSYFLVFLHPSAWVFFKKKTNYVTYVVRSLQLLFFFKKSHATYTISILFLILLDQSAKQQDFRPRYVHGNLLITHNASCYTCDG